MICFHYGAKTFKLTHLEYKFLNFGFFFSYRPPNPIEFLASYLLKNKAQFEDRN